MMIKMQVLLSRAENLLRSDHVCFQESDRDWWSSAEGCTWTLARSTNSVFEASATSRYLGLQRSQDYVLTNARDIVDHPRSTSSPRLDTFCSGIQTDARNGLR